MSEVKGGQDGAALDADRSYPRLQHSCKLSGVVYDSNGNGHEFQLINMVVYRRMNCT